MKKLKSSFAAILTITTYIFLGLNQSTFAMDQIITTNLNISTEEKLKLIDNQTNKFLNNCNNLMACLNSSKNNTIQNLKKSELEPAFSSIFNETTSLIDSIKQEQNKIKKFAENLKTQTENENFNTKFEEFKNNCEQTIKFCLLEYTKINQDSKVCSINNNCDLLFNTNNNLVHDFLIKYIENEYNNLLEKAECLIDKFKQKIIFKEKLIKCKLLKENIQIYFNKFKNVYLNELRNYFNINEKEKYKNLINSTIKKINEIDLDLTSI